MGRIRILVVEDSMTVRKRLVEVLGSDDDLEVVGEAEDGRRAIELCSELRPDAITMDIMLPLMSGLSATEYIMAHFPTPILVVSASTNRGDLFKTYEALAAGAIDVLEKPRGDDSDIGWEHRFVMTIKMVSRIRVITHLRARLALPRANPAAVLPASGPDAPRQRCQVVAIGASTGGPGAVVAVLRGLPLAFSLPVLLVIHINEPFGQAFGDWLDSQTGRRVAYAKDGDAVAGAKGRVLMAPPGSHLVVVDGICRLNQDPERHFCRPSVDVLFQSVARDYGPAATAVLLTGMGKDGAVGLLDIHNAGGFTIAQDEATSVVYGMPREAVNLGAVDRVLPINDIGPVVAALEQPPRIRR